MRQSWDLRSFSAVLWRLPLCSSYSIQRNYMGLENNCIQEQLGQIQDQKILKDKNKNELLFLKSQEPKTGRKSRSGTTHAPSTSIMKRQGNHLSHLSSPAPGRSPTFTSYKEWAWPLSRSRQGNLLLVFTPSCSRPRSPSKALPEFLVWLIVNSYWLGKAKNPGQYQLHWQQIQVFISAWRVSCFCNCYSIITQLSAVFFGT